ncbi:hypothetical protein DEJ45_34800 [Streptomyces venezuelae]|uniref:FG-GAP repeat domain-containing protein n=1 Tax=Streptomyces venezuelae TaxID=54571 RepID=UPI00123D4DF9|nr:VCBS repeat-containing protein [Streptomyces venezuelae]QES17039.1 hypothetical protein DEJ45_34800 [Streptomyces venezuelae]
MTGPLVAGPDLCAAGRSRSSNGASWLQDVHSREGWREVYQNPDSLIGGGWQAYTLLTGGGDLTGDGRPDLVATDGAGRLWLYRSTGSATAPFAARRLIGSGGWQTYDRIIATGNLAGGVAGDLVARDRTGVLWLYLGKGDGTFAARTRLGAGWQRYDDLIGPGDADRDGRPDLYAADINDAIPAPFLYRGTGAWQGPFRPGERVEPRPGQP